jgi:Mg2+/Co2+ transporter CorB
LIKELDDGGVTAEEIKKVVRQLREKGEISEIDRDNLLSLIK